MPSFDRTRVALAATAFLLLWTTVAPAQPPKKAESPPHARVAVGRFKLPDNLTKDVTADTLTDILREFGAGGLRHEAVPSTEALKEVIDRIDTDGKLTRKPAEATGKEARFVLLPTVSGGDADGYLMTATVYDLRTGASRVVMAEERGGGKGTRLDRLRGLAQDLWRQLDTPSLTRALKHDGAVRAMAWSPDGKLLATTSDDDTAKVWGVDGKLLHTLKHDDKVRSMAWSLDGKMLATGSLDKTVKVWGADGTLKSTLEHDQKIDTVAWAPDGTRLATGAGKAVRVWAADGTLRATLNHDDEVGWVWRSVAWSSDGTRLATTMLGDRVKVWGADGTLKATLECGSGIDPLLSIPDLTRLATEWSKDKPAKVWAFDDTLLLPRVPDSHKNDSVVTSWAWCQGRKLLATVADKAVWVWAADGTLRAIVWHEARVKSVAWASDGTRMATGSVDGTARVWDVGPPK